MPIWLVLGALGCAIAAISARSLVHSALWLAATSAVLATLLYTMGAPIVAVIELSVGVGLIAVLFVFVVGVAGEDGVRARSVVPTIIALALAGPATALLAWMVTTGPGPSAIATSSTLVPTSLTTMLWEQRAADVLGQVVLILTGALGVVTILGGASRTGAARTGLPTKLIEGSLSTLARVSLISSSDGPPQVQPDTALPPTPAAAAEMREPVGAAPAPTREDTR